MSYGKLVREFREAAGLTQAELAAKIGRVQPVISRVERSTGRRLSVDLLGTIAQALGRTLADFTVVSDSEKAA